MLRKLLLQALGFSWTYKAVLSWLHFFWFFKNKY